MMPRNLASTTTPLRPARAAFALASLGALASAQGAAERVSTAQGGAEADGASVSASMSGDARFVVFRSAATNLVPGDTNAREDVFLLDRASGALQLVSVGLAGAPGDGDSYEAEISDDGTTVAFVSAATNLVAGDLNGVPDVFVRDLVTGTTERVNVTPAGAETSGLVAWLSISADGNLVALAAEADLVTGAPGQFNGQFDLWVRDRQANTAQKVSVDAAGQDMVFARHPRLTPDGRFVAFRAAPNTGAGPLRRQFLVRDLVNGSVVVASVSSTGQASNEDVYGEAAISADGRFVAFSSPGTNLVPGDTNGGDDVFVRDLVAGITERVSVSNTGVQSDFGGFAPRISADGRFVAFASGVSAFTPGEPKPWAGTFVHDRLTHATSRVNATSGATLNGATFPAELSDDGLSVLLVTVASNVGVPGGDANALDDVYLIERASNAPSSYCTAKTDVLGCTPAIAATGTPSASSAAPFLITATNVSNLRRGRLYWSLAPSNAPFQGGTACLEAPLRASRVLFSHGSPSGNDCTGSFQVAFHSLIQQGIDPALVPGTVVHAQFRYADLPGPGGSIAGLSDALVFAIAP